MRVEEFYSLTDEAKLEIYYSFFGKLKTVKFRHQQTVLVFKVWFTSLYTKINCETMERQEVKGFVLYNTNVSVCLTLAMMTEGLQWELAGMMGAKHKVAGFARSIPTIPKALMC